MRKVVAAAFLVVVCALGCGGKGGVPRLPVSGEVKVGATPVPTGTVMFVGEGNNVVESGPISNGKYTIAKAPVGAVKVAVTSPPPPPAMQAKQKVDGKTSGGGAVEGILLNPKYASADTSGLKHTVGEGAGQTYNIVLVK